MGAVLGVDADILLRFGEDHLRKLVAAADIGEAADSREDFAEGIRTLPGGVEGADTAGRSARDGTALSVFRDFDAFGFG